MSPLEVAATVLTVIATLLSVRRSLWLYPVGIVATALYFGVFATARLYSSAGLQVFFVLVQVYGWWYWLKGDHGQPPKVTRWGLVRTLAVTAIVVAASMGAGFLIGRATNAASAVADATITGLSVLAQFLLDRKKLENWVVWAAVDALAALTYFGQGLHLTGALYLFLLGVVVWGWIEWRTAVTAHAAPIP